MTESVKQNYQDNLIRSGDGQVSSVKLYSSESSEPYDLTLVWENISIFENLTTPYIRGQITITDTQNLIQEVPIVCNERIEIKFKTASAFEFVTIIGHIVQIPSRIRAGQGVQTYVLDFVSSEFIRSKSVKVKKAYKNTLISDMVIDIYNQYMYPANGKKLNIVPTLNIESKVIPNLAPHSAIMWLAKWARAPEYRLGASYVFFENQYGFYFGPIEALIDPDKFTTSGKYKVTNVNVQQNDVLDLKGNLESIAHYKIDSGNHLNLLDEGVYASTALSHDLVMRTITKKTHNYVESFDNLTHLNSGDTKIHNDPRIGSIADSNVTIIPSHYNAFGNQINASRSIETVLTRQSQLKAFDSNSMTITIPGHSERAVGEVLFLSLPSIGKTNLEGSIGEQDKYLSGRYLVHSLRHELVREEQNTLPKYRIHMRVVRDSVLTPIPTQRVFDNKTIPA